MVKGSCVLRQETRGSFDGCTMGLRAYHVDWQGSKGLGGSGNLYKENMKIGVIEIWTFENFYSCILLKWLIMRVFKDYHKQLLRNIWSPYQLDPPNWVLWSGREGPRGCHTRGVSRGGTPGPIPVHVMFYRFCMLSWYAMARKVMPLYLLFKSLLLDLWRPPTMKPRIVRRMGWHEIEMCIVNLSCTTCCPLQW